MGYTVQNGMSDLAGRFQKEQALGINAIVQFQITGEQAATYHMIIKDQHLSLKESAAEKPDLTLTMSTVDFLDLMTGRLEGAAAFVSGKLKVTGDMMLAMQLAAIFFS
jgi:putative sterol carrier protein